MTSAAGRIAAPASSVEYPRTFWRYCWLTNMAAINEPKTMIPAHAATQKMRRDCDLQVVQRVRRTALADEEREQRRRGDHGETEHECPLVRHGSEVDREDERPDEHDREDPAEVVDRLARLVHVARHEEERHYERDDRERQSDQEDGPPFELLEQRARRRAGRARRSRRRAPTRARSTSSAQVPDHSAVMSASVVGYAIPAASPPPTRATKSTSSEGAIAPRGATWGSRAPSRGRASACARSGPRSRRDRAPTRQARASSRRRSG